MNSSLCSHFLKVLATSLLLGVVLSPSAFAGDSTPLKEGTEIIPIRPDGQRDWSANRYRVEGDQAVPIRPDGQRDWSANTYHSEGGKIVPVRADGQRDWGASSGKR